MREGKYRAKSLDFCPIVHNTVLQFLETLLGQLNCRSKSDNKTIHKADYFLKVYKHVLA